MSDQKLRELGAYVEDTRPLPDFDDLVGRARRRVAIRRTGLLAAVVAATVVAGIGVTQVVDRDRQPSPPPVERPRVEQPAMTCATATPSKCFAGIHGWIAFEEPGRPGIWAVNPAEPGNPEAVVRVTEGRNDEPLEWSRDGTKLLVRRVVARSSAEPLGMPHVELAVLYADGTEIRIAQADSFLDGSFSPDGSQVIYSGYGSDGIHVVDADGGTAETLLAAGSRRVASEEGTELHDTQLYNAVFSPDGTTIAYFDGMGDWGHSLRVMDTDGTDVRVLYEEDEASHVRDLVWSPDGQRLMFTGDAGLAGIWIIGVDGSGLDQVSRHGVDPAWSPDGTRISYVEGRRLIIADPDGTNATTFDHGGSGPWNPLALERP